MAQPGRFTVLSMAGKELEAQDQSEHSTPGPTVSPMPQLTHSLNRRLWILGQASVSFWGSAPGCSSDLLSTTGTQDTDSLISPGVSEKEVTAGPPQGSVHRLRGLGQEMRQRLHKGVARAPRLSGWPLRHPWVQLIKPWAACVAGASRLDGNGLKLEMHQREMPAGGVLALLIYTPSCHSISASNGAHAATPTTPTCHLACLYT